MWCNHQYGSRLEYMYLELDTFPDQESIPGPFWSWVDCEQTRTIVLWSQIQIFWHKIFALVNLSAQIFFIHFTFGKNLAINAGHSKTASNYYALKYFIALNFISWDFFVLIFSPLNLNMQWFCCTTNVFQLKKKNTQYQIIWVEPIELKPDDRMNTNWMTKYSWPDDQTRWPNHTTELYQKTKFIYPVYPDIKTDI